MVRQEAKVGFRVAKCSSDDGTAPRDRTGTRTELESHTLCSPLLKMINAPLQKEINAALNLVLNN